MKIGNFEKENAPVNRYSFGAFLYAKFSFFTALDRFATKFTAPIHRAACGGFAVRRLVGVFVPNPCGWIFVYAACIRPIPYQFHLWRLSVNRNYCGSRTFLEFLSIAISLYCEDMPSLFDGWHIFGRSIGNGSFEIRYICFHLLVKLYVNPASKLDEGCYQCFTTVSERLEISSQNKCCTGKRKHKAEYSRRRFSYAQNLSPRIK